MNSLNKVVLFLAAGLRGPAAGAAFAVGAFSVAGVPPAAGFLSKVAVFKASAAVDALPASVTLVALIFVGSAMSFVYSFQVYQRRFMAPKQGDPPGKPSPATARFLVVALAALVLLVGLWPEPLLLLSEAAATALSSGGSS